MYPQFWQAVQVGGVAIPRHMSARWFDTSTDLCYVRGVKETWSGCGGSIFV